MIMKVYEYYHTDINDQNLYYTACQEDFDGWADRDSTGRIFEAEMPDGVCIGRDGSGMKTLYDKCNRPLHIVKRKDGTYFLVFSQAVRYGYSWTESIYKRIILKQVSDKVKA